jgi:ribosomal protein S27E
MKAKTPRTRVSTITCGACGHEIFSRARHDFKSCKCGSVHIDGGFDYLKAGFKTGVSHQVRHRYVKATRAELYDDWNRRIDKFGTITPPIPEKDTLPPKRPSKKDK